MKKIEERFIRHKKALGSSVHYANVVPVNFRDDSLRDGTQSQTGLCFNDEVFNEFETKQQINLDQKLANISVSASEVESILVDLHAVWDDSKFDELYVQCRRQVIESIVGPLGLGGFVATFDKVGGNVTTVNNAKKGIFARQDIEGFKRDDYTGNGDYAKNSNNYRDRQSTSDFMVQDEYVNSKIYYKDVDNRSSVDVDHIVSTKQYHSEGGFIQSKKQRSSFGSDEKNFATTSKSINRSLKDADKLEWANSLNAADPTKTNAEYYHIDIVALKKTVRRGEKAAQEHAPDVWDWSKYYSERVTITGCIESGKMGLQQAIGLLLTNLFDKIFDEVKDSYDNGFISGCDGNSFFEALSTRCARIGEDILSDWKAVLVAFKDGSVAGFVSNIVTTVINSFCTTAKNMIRLIREGLFSLLKALKTIFLRPEGTTLAQASDAAMKLVVAGIITIGGVSLQEYLHIHLTPIFSTIPLIGAYGDTLTSIVGGGITAIFMSLGMCVIDRMDIFGIRDDERHQFVVETLRKDNVLLESSIYELYDLVVGVDIV